MVNLLCPVDCSCHTGPYAACSAPGGCGTAGCGRTDDARSGSCPCCWRRDPYAGLVCDPCRAWLPTALAGITDRYAQLPAVLEPGTRQADRVTGTPDPAAPLNIDAEDLMTRVVRRGGIPVDATADTILRAPTLTRVLADWWTPAGHRQWQRHQVEELRRDHVEQPAGDQIGYLPVAQVLDSWVRDWIDARAMREHRPTPTVPTLVDWLTNRLPWACDRYEPIGDFAASVRTIRGNLMSVLGEFDPPPEPCDGVQCKRCDRRQLVRTQDGSGDVECTNPDCLKIYGAEEYADWARHLGAYERSQRPDDDIRDLLRRREPARPDAA